jgi:hypothetical protein
MRLFCFMWVDYRSASAPDFNQDINNNGKYNHYEKYANAHAGPEDVTDNFTG